MTKNFLNLSLSNILPNAWCFNPKKYKFSILLPKGSYFSLSPSPSTDSSPPDIHTTFLGTTGKWQSVMLINVCVIQKRKEICFPVFDIFCFPPIFPQCLGMALSYEDPGYCSARWNTENITYAWGDANIPTKTHPWASAFPVSAFHTTIKHLWAAGHSLQIYI